MSAADACAIGVGAVCGALSRYQVGRVAAEKIAKNENLKALSGWHTAGINVAGSFALGAISAFPMADKTHNQITSSRSKLVIPPQIENIHISPRAKLMLGIGFCGSFTTFSTYSVDMMNMLNRGETMKAFQYGIVNNAGGLFAAFAGFAIVKKLFRL